MAVVYPIQYPIVLEVLDLVLSKTKYVEYWCTPRCLTKLKTAWEFGFFGLITKSRRTSKIQYASFFSRKMECWSRIESKVSRFYKIIVYVQNDSCLKSSRTLRFEQFWFSRKMEHWSRIESKNTRFYKRTVCAKNGSHQKSRRFLSFFSFNVPFLAKNQI